MTEIRSRRIRLTYWQRKLLIFAEFLFGPCFMIRLDLFCSVSNHFSTRVSSTFKIESCFEINVSEVSSNANLQFNDFPKFEFIDKASSLIKSMSIYFQWCTFSIFFQTVYWRGGGGGAVTTLFPRVFSRKRVGGIDWEGSLSYSLSVRVGKKISPQITK